ncbi:MAG TPA: transporter, partial [Novosphingobium sp.]|nr:transporter [Novosphingobium sp.]
MIKTRKLALAMALSAAAIAHPAAASESGGGVYPVGAEGALGGALPPPGVYLLGYLQSYEAGRFNDGKGNAGFLPDFHVSAEAAVTRVVWNTGRKFLGADYAMHLVAPAVVIDARVAGVSDRRAGFTDVTIDPFILGWHWKSG